MNKRERLIEFNKATKTKHGHAVDGKYTKTYYCYYSMLQRCYNSNNISYPNYGAKSITVCDRWRYGEGSKSGFECFLKDMGEASEGLSIDRINVNGNYEPSNCVWATVKEQANNKSTSRYITYKGRTQTLAQWAEELNINAVTLAGRLDKQNMSVKEAFTTPVIKRTKGITYQGRTLTIAKWAKEVGIDRKVIGWRLRNGWNVENALTTPLDISKSRKKTAA